jgi:hypothetical protein
MNPSESNPIKVVFIGASSRSGSTLLDRILGSHPEFVSTGELRRIWDRGLVQNQPCGCGSLFRLCPFWTQVLETAFPSLNDSDLKEIAYAKQQVESRRSVFRLMLHLERSGKYGKHFMRYAAAMTDLLTAIARVSGKRTIVDSSKMAMHGFFLNRLNAVDLYFIHLVRDSRGVTHSMQRKKQMFSGTEESRWMSTKKPVASALDWNLMNGMLRLLSTVCVRTLLIRYEDLVTQTENCINEILMWLGEPMRQSIKFQNQTIELQMNHTVSGNPMRFQTGATRIQPDFEWRSSDCNQRRLVTALTWPFLWMYRYKL